MVPSSNSPQDPPTGDASANLAGTPTLRGNIAACADRHPAVLAGRPMHLACSLPAGHDGRHRCEGGSVTYGIWG